MPVTNYYSLKMHLPFWKKQNYPKLQPQKKIPKHKCSPVLYVEWFARLTVFQCLRSHASESVIHDISTVFLMILFRRLNNQKGINTKTTWREPKFPVCSLWCAKIVQMLIVTNNWNGQNLKEIAVLNWTLLNHQVPFGSLDSGVWNMGKRIICGLTLWNE